MTSLFPQDWSDLIDRMLADINGPLVDKLLKFHTKSSDVKTECDSDCRRAFVCKFKQARPGSLISC